MRRSRNKVYESTHLHYTILIYNVVSSKESQVIYCSKCRLLLDWIVDQLDMLKMV